MYNFDDSIICPDDPTATPGRINQYRDYYKVKYDICEEQNPLTIAEIGVRAGYSAWAFLQACPNAKYIGIDANNGRHGGAGGEDGKFMRWAEKILSDYQVEFIEMNTQSANDLSGVVCNVDLFHIDGDHSTKGVYHDLTLAANVLSETGVIVVDDIDYINGVKVGADSWLKDNPTYTVEYKKSLRGEYLIRKGK